MAEKLVKYYELIEKKAGIQGQMRMIMLTGVAAFIAKNVPDAPQTLARFQQAFKEITGQDAPPI